MKKTIGLIGFSLLVMGLTGCAFFKSAGRVDKAADRSLAVYSGPKAKIAVIDFEIRAAKAGSDIGSGLREMLVAALTNSNRFNVAERKSADLIITAAVTEFEPQASGGKSGLGGGGGVGSGVLGGLLGTSLNKARMALDLRVVNTSTSEVLASTRIQGQASDISGAMIDGSFGNWALAGALSAYADTPMEKAIRTCIIEAARYISKAVPANFYKH